MKTVHGSMLAVAGTCLLFGVLVQGAERATEPLSQVKEKIEQGEAVLVDVREPAEWKKGHIKGAVSLPISELQAGVDREQLEEMIPKDKLVYTHCVTGRRAAAAGNILSGMGYNVRFLTAGYQELVEAGFEKAE